VGRFFERARFVGGVWRRKATGLKGGVKGEAVITAGGTWVVGMLERNFALKLTGRNAKKKRVNSIGSK